MKQDMPPLKLFYEEEINYLANGVYTNEAWNKKFDSFHSTTQKWAIYTFYLENLKANTKYIFDPEVHGVRLSKL